MWQFLGHFWIFLNMFLKLWQIFLLKVFLKDVLTDFSTGGSCSGIGRNLHDWGNCSHDVDGHQQVTLSQGCHGPHWSLNSPWCGGIGGGCLKSPSNLFEFCESSAGKNGDISNRCSCDVPGTPSVIVISGSHTDSWDGSKPMINKFCLVIWKAVLH